MRMPHTARERRQSLFHKQNTQSQTHARANRELALFCWEHEPKEFGRIVVSHLQSSSTSFLKLLILVVT